MAKKKESVGVIKPKRVVKKSTEVDKELSWIEAMHEIDAVFKIRVNEIKEGMVSREEYDYYVKNTKEWGAGTNARVSSSPALNGYSQARLTLQSGGNRL